MNNFTNGFDDNPNLRLDMMRLLEEGESITGIGRIYGVSRDRVRTKMKRFGLSKREPLSKFTAEEVDEWVKELISGLALGELAKRLSTTTKVIGAYLEKHSYDIEQVKRERSKHLHDGEVYGYWQVIPGSYRHHEILRGTLDCRCVCGEIRTVKFGNLVRGASKSCGCMGYSERKAYPWVCTETGQAVICTEELSRTIGINALTLYTYIHKNLPVIDSEGREWVAQLDKGVRPGLARSTIVVWTNQTTQEQVFGNPELAEITQGALNTIKLYASKKIRFRSSLGEIWIPKTIQRQT